MSNLSSRQDATPWMMGCCFLALLAWPNNFLMADDQPLIVNVSNFIRAESDRYFSETAKADAFGKLQHRRAPVPIDKQAVIRMNRDTLYSNGVFDLEASPLTVTLPDAGKRYMSLQAVSQDHYTTEVLYAPGRYTYTKDKVGTRYVFLIIRTLADAEKQEDIKATNELQDAIKIEQEKKGTFEVPVWDTASLNKVRDGLLLLGSCGGTKTMFGTKAEVDPVSHLIGAAGGWGGNPASAAIYINTYVKENDGKTGHRLTVKDVPVDGFWSISVYNAKGFFEKNDLGAYSVNNLTAKPNKDGSYTLQFGGDPKEALNYLPISPAWNYTIRLYRPRKEILTGTWKFPEATPIK